MEGARYATWSAPTDVGAVPPEKVGLPPGFWLIGVLSSVVFSLLLLIALPWWVAVLAGVALGAFFTFRVSMISLVSEWFARRRKGSAAAFAMYKSMGVTNAHPVRVNVILDAYQIGTDEGLVEFSDGLLKFHGTKTRFALSADLANETAFYSGAALPKVNGLDHMVQIWPFERLDPNEDRVISHLYVRELQAWTKAAPEPSSEVVLPPNAPASRKDIRAMRDSASPIRDAMFLLLTLQYLGRAIDEGGWILIAVGMLAVLAAVGFGIGIRDRNRFYRNLPK